MSLKDLVSTNFGQLVPREILIDRYARAIITELTTNSKKNAERNKFGADLGGGLVCVTFDPNDTIYHQGIKHDVIKAVVSAFVANGFTVAKTNSTNGHNYIGPVYMQISVEACCPGDYGREYCSTENYDDAVRLTICM